MRLKLNIFLPFFFIILFCFSSYIIKPVFADSNSITYSAPNLNITYDGTSCDPSTEETAFAYYNGFVSPVVGGYALGGRYLNRLSSYTFPYDQSFLSSGDWTVVLACVNYNSLNYDTILAQTQFTIGPPTGTGFPNSVTYSAPNLNVTYDGTSCDPSTEETAVVWYNYFTNPVTGQSALTGYRYINQYLSWEFPWDMTSPSFTSGNWTAVLACINTTTTSLDYDAILAYAQFTIASSNTPPAISSISNAIINEGDTYSASSSFTDPDSTSWTATVDYGDSTGTQNLPLSGTNFSLSHQYKDEGTYTVTVKATDNQGATGTGTATVTVNDATPNVGVVTISPNPVQISTSVSATATFTDPGVFDTHYATANWGDGTNIATSCSITEPSGSTPGFVNCPFSIGYAAANIYPVTITVYDDDNVQRTSPVTYESVYNPTQSSIFTAGANFSNPSTASSNTSGTVKFGLSYKYQGGMATGDKTFTMDFNEANLHFNATSVASLVVSSGMATLEGSGTLNGISGYTFLVTGVNSGDIRISITDSSNNVVYDTQPGAAISATPTTSVTGHVIVH